VGAFAGKWRDSKPFAAPHDSGTQLARPLLTEELQASRSLKTFKEFADARWRQMPGSRAGGSGAIQQTRAWRVEVKNLIARFVREEQGQDLIEYGLLVGIITVGAIAAITSIGPKVTKYFTDLDGKLVATP
jgi:pilus assembly protein Flp/PilA